VGAAVLIAAIVGVVILVGGGDDEQVSDTTDATEPSEDTEPSDRTDATEPSEDTNTSDITVPSDVTSAGDFLDELRQQLIDLGLTQEQADCVIDRAFELGTENPGETPSNEELLDIYTQCDVDLSDLGG
jgi:hypothetical protein